LRRVSVGGALARAAWGGIMRAAKLIQEEGKFDDSPTLHRERLEHDLPRD